MINFIGASVGIAFMILILAIIAGVMAKIIYWVWEKMGLL